MVKISTLELNRNWDLLAIIIYSIIMAAFLVATPRDIITPILFIPLIFLFPGYEIINALLPQKRTLDLFERISLSFGLSIGILVIISVFILIVLQNTYDEALELIFWSYVPLNILLSFLNAWRRKNVWESYSPSGLNLILTNAFHKIKGDSKLEKVLTIFLVLAIFTSVLSIAYVIAYPKEDIPFTEFYILGPDGKTTNYPQNLTIDQSSTIALGIVNHEQREVSYSIEIWLVNETARGDLPSINHLYYFGSINTTLDHIPSNTNGMWSKQWEERYTISIPYYGQYSIWFVLLKDGQPFIGNPHIDYAETAAKDHFLTMIEGAERNLNLHLNLNIT